MSQFKKPSSRHGVYLAICNEFGTLNPEEECPCYLVRVHVRELTRIAYVGGRSGEAVSQTEVTAITGVPVNLKPDIMEQLPVYVPTECIEWEEGDR